MGPRGRNINKDVDKNNHKNTHKMPKLFFSISRNPLEKILCAKLSSRPNLGKNYLVYLILEDKLPYHHDRPLTRHNGCSKKNKQTIG